MTIIAAWVSVKSVVRHLKTSLFSILAFIFAFAGGAAWCQEDPKPDVSEGMDAVLLLDSSGSMLMTDPFRLRDEGAKLFVEFLKGDDRLGIVEFSDAAKIVRPLGSVSGDDREKVQGLIGQIKTLGQYTDLLAPLEVAEDLFANSPRDGARKIVIMLSDGKMEPDPKVGAAAELTSRLLNMELPDLKTKDIKVYTLSFSDNADNNILSQVAAGTGGVHRFAPSVERIHSDFAELFVAAKKPQMLPISSKGFRIDGEVQEATFYINRQGENNVTLVSPSGVKLTPDSIGGGLKWFRGSEFDVITIETPEAGQWEIVGLPKNEGFATVLTSLKLVTTWPAAINAGNPTLLEARLFEAKKPIVLPQMTGVVTYAYDVTPTDRVSEPIIRAKLLDKGGAEDSIAGDGIYSAKVEIEEPGEYRLRVLADGPTFSRYQQLSFRVKPRLVTLDTFKERGSFLHSFGPKVDGQSEEDSGIEDEDFFRLRLSSELVGSKKLQAKLIVFDQEENRYILPLTRIEELVYAASAEALPRDGKFRMKATVEAEGKRRERLFGESKILEYERLPREGRKAVEVVIMDQKPKKKAGMSPIWGMLFWLVVISAANGGLCFFGLSALSKAQENVGNVSTVKFDPVDAMMAGLMTLEKRSQVVEIDLEDPRLTSNAAIPLPARKRGAAPAKAQAVENAAPQSGAQESAPQGDAAETAAAESMEPAEGAAEESEGADAGGKATEEDQEAD